MSITTRVTRAITEADLDGVIALDARISGTSRRGFFNKHFAAVKAAPANFIWLVEIVGDKLAGFVSARILDGEFGTTRPIAVLDVLGTAPELRGQGVARTLMASLEAECKSRKISDIRTEADWHQHDLVKFFGSAGFELAPVFLLECDTSTTNF